MVVMPRHVPRHIAPHCTSLHVCTLLELFVYQSLYLSTLVGAVQTKIEDCMESVYQPVNMQ